MKKILAIIMAGAMALTMTACSAPKETAKVFTADELVGIINEARKGSDFADMQISTSADEEQSQMLFDSLGFKDEDVEEYAVSMSFVNIKAYNVAIIKPAKDKEQAVSDALDGYIANTQKNFEQYLQDQYEVAKATVKTTTENGYIVMVMCEDAQAVSDSITAALAK